MKVIFTDNVAGVGSKGDIRNVKNGYFRNFLMPRKKAVFATLEAVKQWEERRKQMLIEKAQLKEKFEEITRRLGGARVRLEKKITAKGTLYGGVKAADIAHAVQEQMNIEIPAEAVVMKTAIKAVGTHELVLKLAEGIETKLSVEVVEKK